jgi:hypothetical protein
MPIPKPWIMELKEEGAIISNVLGLNLCEDCASKEKARLVTLKQNAGFFKDVERQTTT